MAKNWTMAEAVVAIAKNDGEAILDIGRRFPLLTSYVAKAVAGDGQAVVALFASIPEYLTANKVQTALKNALGDVSEVEDEDDAEEAVEEKPAKPVKKAEKKPAKKAEVEEADEDDAEDEEATDDYDAINGSKLYEMCKERGILSKCKTKKKADLIAALREDDANGGSDAAEEEDEEEGTEYDGMSAQELFKECKKRGIKAELKKPAKYYIDLLVADDNREEDADEDDEWEDEEEEAPKKPAKKAEKPAAKPAPKKEEKKPAKKAAKVEEEEDEDDDWDI